MRNYEIMFIVKTTIEEEAVKKTIADLKAIITDGEHEIIDQLGMVEKSINAPIKKQELVERFSKLNDTPFVLNDIDCFIFIKLC